MKQLKCLDNFKCSTTNYYSEDEMQIIGISMLKERGVEIEDIASLIYIKHKMSGSDIFNNCKQNNGINTHYDIFTSFGKHTYFAVTVAPK